ncbi:MAG: four helix bundle suffix domain-containing protein [Lentisphaerota bacterium]
MPIASPARASITTSRTIFRTGWRNICGSGDGDYLLDQQIRRLEQDFLRQGGLRERMTRARIEAREQQRMNPRWTRAANIGYCPFRC